MLISSGHGEQRPHHDGYGHGQALVRAFAIWKSVLLLLVVASSLGGPPYDTSTTLVAQRALTDFDESALDLGTKLTRWDAIYFVQNARRGYLFEQEWAFGSGMPFLISTIVRAFAYLGVEPTSQWEPLVGICIAHASHLLSVLVLYRLGLRIGKDPQTSFVAALLHILSPAGIFLSAPYQESPFALLSFLGYLLLAHGCLGQSRSIRKDAAIVTSGIVFGLATLFRSNGLLSGVSFAVFALAELHRLVTTSMSLGNLRRLAALGIGGVAVAMGSLVPQTLAYQTFCTESSVTATLRPWCQKTLPSIYTFVQEKYWNVGLFRYWTPGNIPLFLLSAPVLFLMMRSGLATLLPRREVAPESSARSAAGLHQQLSPDDASLFVGAMALSQVILTTLAITTYHIQIITRIASAYPIWYWWLAGQLKQSVTTKFGGGVVVFMVMYASIQGALFASFLPPA
ncbi:GPI mannosyltransferase 2 [Apiospora rasikravindrae]|uniref:GPI mannosyltransferase 2 n=1 Tax=Apiospora rasikravindrae TaxID=990691 RepID=A0ABR1TG65_9PEZI